MGFISFWKRVFIGEIDDDPELRAARSRHNIDVGEEKGQRKGDREEEARKPYDPWEDIDNMRRNFFMGSWASRKFRVIGEDKLKADLEALERKREEKRKAKEEGRS